MAEHRLHGVGFGDVALRRGRPVGVDVVHLIQCDAAALEAGIHGADGAVSVLRRLA